MNRIIPSKQSSFDDAFCNTTTSSLTTNNQFEPENIPNYLNTKSSSFYHTYKYSRREQKNFYASVKRARLKKQNQTVRKSRQNPLIFDQTNFSIHLPTKITSRQRLNTNSSNSYPLIFDPNFHSLVQLSTNEHFQEYFPYIQSYFHLIHSIASQEFQTIVNSNDQQHQLSYTAFSFLHILRQTMSDYSLSLQRTLKRNYFQSFQSDLTSYKSPRYEQGSAQSHPIDLTPTIFSAFSVETDQTNTHQRNPTVV